MLLLTMLVELYMSCALLDELWLSLMRAPVEYLRDVECYSNNPLRLCNLGLDSYSQEVSLVQGASGHMFSYDMHEDTRITSPL